MKDSHARSIVKGITWRAIGTMDTIVLSFVVTGNIGHSVQIGLSEVITKIALYYLHERLWNVIPYGRMSTKGPSHSRSLLKGISWRAIGTLDTMLLAYIVTGEPINALTIGGFELFTKIALFYLHERLWSLVKWGRLNTEYFVSSHASSKTMFEKGKENSFTKRSKEIFLQKN